MHYRQCSDRILLFLAHVLCILLIFFGLIANLNAAPPIHIEVKVFGQDVIFILYRSKDQVIDFNYTKSGVSVNVNTPSEFTLLNPNQFNKYASNLQFLANQQQVTFKLKKELSYQNVINGEKLDAIKFRTRQEKPEDLSTISAAKNDPGGVKYSKKDNNHILSFDLGNANSKMTTFIKDGYLWVIFDQKKSFAFKKNTIFTQFDLIRSDAGTVLRIKLDQVSYNPRVKPNNSGWDIILSSTDSEDVTQNTKHAILSQSLVEDDGLLIKGEFKNRNIISFEDPDLGDVIATVPLAHNKGYVASQRDAIEFSLLKSIQGIAFILHSDDVVVEKYDNAIKVISDTALPQNLVDSSNTLLTTMDQMIDLPTILPYLNQDLDALDFVEQKSTLVREASLAQNNYEAFKINIELANFFFKHELYNESLDALELAKKYSPDDYKVHLQARFLHAVNLTLIGEYSIARDEYEDLLSYYDVQKIAEVNLWNKYNEFSLGAQSHSIGFVDHVEHTIALYSDDKYWPMVFADIELALRAHDLKTIEHILREVRKAPEGKYSNSLKFYRASYYQKKKQYNLAKQYYRDLIYQDNDLFNQVRANFALVKLQLANKELLLEKAIQILDHLRYSWRGDQIEYEILLKLASYYRDTKDIMSALRTYQYAQTAFSNKISNFYITSEMSKIFNDVFLPGGLGEEMDDFTIVALFYEFKELNPIGDQGDDVIIGIAKRFVMLDLLDNAINLLRHQVTYRLQGRKRVINADNLAIVLIMNKKPREAILVLDDTDKDNVNFQEHEYRVRLRARALIALEKYDKAIQYLKDDQSEDAKTIIREALFQSENWAGYIDTLNDEFENLIGNINNNASTAQDILRLAIAYYQLNAQDKLIMLSTYVKTHKTLKDTVALLISSVGEVDYKNLDASLDIDQMKILLDKYKNQFLRK